MLGLVMFLYVLGVYILWLFIASKFGKSHLFDFVAFVAAIWGFFEVAGRFV